MISEHQQIEDFRKFLNKWQWDLFVTITFAKPKCVRTARTMFKYFFKHLNKGEDRFYEKFIFSFVLYEQENVRDGVHIHSFIRGISPLLATELNRKCKFFSPQSCVFPYNSKQRGKFYLANKYVSPKMVDYDFFKINSRVRKSR